MIDARFVEKVEAIFIFKIDISYLYNVITNISVWYLSQSLLVNCIIIPSHFQFEHGNAFKMKVDFGFFS